MRQFSAFLAALIISLTPVSALAAPPSVTGLKADYKDNAIMVSWNASEDLTVAYYRIYWSRQSILENGGRWEDFAATAGKEPAYQLRDFPQAPSLWIAVMAVTTYGEESPVFTEEVKVDLFGGTASSAQSSAAVSTSSVSTDSPASSASSVSSASSSMPLTFDLLSAQAVSATGVLLTFSMPISIKATDAAKAFTLIDASGSLLQARKITLKDNTMLIVTLPQRRDMQYIVSVSDVVKSPSGKSVSPARSQLTFMGHLNGLTAESAQNQQQNVLVQDVANLNIRAEQQLDGTYTVTATWLPRDAVANITAYQIQQTQDNAQTWSEAQTVPSNTTSIRVAGVRSGMFGFIVKVIGSNGLFSRGTYGSIELPAFDPGQPPQNQPPLTGNVTNPPVVIPKPPRVPQTGAPEVLVVLLAGLAGGFHTFKKRQLRLTEAESRNA